MDMKPKLTIGDLYPGLSETELHEADMNLKLYLALLLRIFERIESDRSPHSNRLTQGGGTLPCTPPNLKRSQL
jgi:hypothetical protein